MPVKVGWMPPVRRKISVPAEVLGYDSGFEFTFHAETLAFDEDRVGMME